MIWDMFNYQLKNRIYLQESTTTHNYHILDNLDDAKLGIIKFNGANNFTIAVDPIVRKRYIATEAMIQLLNIKFASMTKLFCQFPSSNQQAINLFKLFAPATKHKDITKFIFHKHTYNNISWRDFYLTRIKQFNRCFIREPSQEPQQQLYCESCQLTAAETDIFNRNTLLHPVAKRAWQQMQAAALNDKIILQIISAYRSLDYQKQLISHKLAKGLLIEEILRVNTLPGFSEHHTGCAIDIGSPKHPVLESEFDQSPAFSWLNKNAKKFNFYLSYPKHNNTGITYEPWHWCYQL
ncbi:D-alanyl-D-alanine carboxypeptidase [hydrothermal vent metagenome]|uniref:D-alanyl-D-alanine carboxypeptidase n=1 Tax=hydrothermal vent metagenome TaxID=652676 RepID=A0A3B0V3P0_9ZZZZ